LTGTAFYVARLGDDGSGDSAFADGGIAVTAFRADDSLTFHAAQQPDGKVIIAGSLDGRFVLERYENAINPPQISSVRVESGVLVVEGEFFDRGSVILVDGAVQKTSFDARQPGHGLRSKRAVRALPQGRSAAIEVRTADGATSQQYQFPAVH
jgi:hypothetical protein